MPRYTSKAPVPAQHVQAPVAALAVTDAVLPAAAKAPARRSAKSPTKSSGKTLVKASAVPSVKAVAAAQATGDARGTLLPEHWISAATDVLVDEGIDHVKVDVLATKLGVTRGSFYWHFRDRQELLRRVLQAWTETTTQQLTQRLKTAHTDAPLRQLRDVISLPFRGRSAARAARIELAIRAWARRDAMARQAVDDGDAARLAYHVQIFKALGFDDHEAAMRAFVLYSYEVAESMLSRQGTASQKQQRSAYIERMVLQPLR
jgi:AcrR family transcriptional regulator